MTVTNLPTLNAILNTCCALLLLAGYVRIKAGDPKLHKRFMILALIVSLLFFKSYVFYHAVVGSVPYPHFDWTRPLYFTILIPHIILAALVWPFIITAVVFAVRGKFSLHKRLVRWVWPIWMFVSVSGITVYLMLYQL